MLELTESSVSRKVQGKYYLVFSFIPTITRTDDGWFFFIILIFFLIPFLFFNFFFEKKIEKKCHPRSSVHIKQLI